MEEQRLEQQQRATREQLYGWIDAAEASLEQAKSRNAELRENFEHALDIARALREDMWKDPRAEAAAVILDHIIETLAASPSPGGEGE